MNSQVVNDSNHFVIKRTHSIKRSNVTYVHGFAQAEIKSNFCHQCITRARTNWLKLKYIWNFEYQSELKMMESNSNAENNYSGFLAPRTESAKVMFNV